MTLSLCMIVKNEADVLARALGNASAYADEIIVVDTGSTDGTKGIAKKLTDKVFDYEWHDDFAAARNYALSKATCDLWMWLDADDIVPPETARGIAELVRAFPTGVDVVMLPYVLDTDSAGEPTFSYYRERIMRRSPEYMWQGRVHEAVTLRGNVVRAPHRIIHAKPTGRTSGTRNLDIYKKMLADGAELNARERYYYARELYYNNDHKTAAEEFERFLGGGALFAPNAVDACIMLSRCLTKLGDRKAAVRALFRSFEYGLPTGEAACEIGLAFFSDGEYAKAAYWFERALDAKPDSDSGAFVDHDCYGFLPCVWLTVCYDRLGKARTAYYWHCRAKKLRPEHPSVVANQKYFNDQGFGT